MEINVHWVYKQLAGRQTDWREHKLVHAGTETSEEQQMPGRTSALCNYSRMTQGGIGNVLQANAGPHPCSATKYLVIR